MRAGFLGFNRLSRIDQTSLPILILTNLPGAWQTMHCIEEGRETEVAIVPA